MFRLSVRIADDVRERLDRLRNDLTREMGHRVSYQLILSRAISAGLTALGYPPGPRPTALPPDVQEKDG